MGLHPNATDNFRAALHISHYHGCPVAEVNGVHYVFDYGEGYTMDPVQGPCPVYVWRVAGMEMTALPHVAEALDAKYALAMDMLDAERAAGWDARP